MLKRYIAAAVAVALGFTTPSMAAPDSAVSAPLNAAAYATAMQSIVGQKFEGGITIVSVAAEENTLVLGMDGPAGWLDGMSTQEISDAFIGGFCGTAPDFFEGGITARVDSTTDGKNPIKGPLVSECPN